MRFYIALISIVFLSIFYSRSYASGEKTVMDKTVHPNIIFFLADDMRWDAMSCAGNEIIKTPNLDMLANNGIMFRNAFVTTSICAISRASILTGQYVSKHGINDFKTSLPDKAFSQTYPMLLKKGGYQVGFIGKYGIGKNTNGVAEQFDYFWGTAHQPVYENKDRNGNYIHYTDMVDDHINEFLKTTHPEKPFCLSVSFKSPHCQGGDSRQFIYKPEFKDLYANDFIPEQSTNNLEEWNKFPAFFKKNNEARKRWEYRFSTLPLYQEMVKGYYRLVTGMDEVIGNVWEQLKSKGIEKNTIIIFLSDNGFYLGEHGLAGKWYAHEPSIRVPLIIYNPLRQESAGKVVTQMALNIDIAPTILSLAEVDIPESMQGGDLNKIMNGNKKSAWDWRTSFYYEHSIKQFPTIPPTQALRNQRYKYIIYPETSPVYEEVYDLKKDKAETQNLVLVRKKNKLVNKLRAEFKKDQAKVTNEK